MTRLLAVAALMLVSQAAGAAETPADAAFKNTWVHAGPTSAVIYWQMDDISKDAQSCVEYGETAEYGKKTEKTAERRWSYLHRMTGLQTGKTYHYRMFLIDGAKVTASPDRTFETKMPEGAVAVAGGGQAVTLDRAGATYFLTGDVTSSGIGVEITGANVTLEMDGHKVTFGQGGAARCHGILISAPGAKVLNGVVEQGKPGAESDYALASFGRAEKLEAAGLSLYVHYRSSYPVALINRAVDVDIHHNYCLSDTVTLKSRHYPGNDLIRVDPAGAVKVRCNILVRGCHRGMAFFRDGAAAGRVEVYENEIAHDEGYVNGYAINSCDDMEIHHNRVVSCARGMHVTSSNLDIHDNWLNLTQHQVYDDRPQGSTTYRHYYTENHGIKLEDPGTNVKIHGNTVISTQPQPEPGAPQRFSTGIKTVPGLKIEEESGLPGDRDHYAPATPLNFHSEKQADVEVYGNTFVAVTTYAQSKQATAYYKPGEWAAAIRAADAFNGKLLIHDNVFKSNDLFVNARALSPGVKIEKNRFILLPKPTENHRACLGDGVAEVLRAGGNTFEGQQP